LNSLSIFAFTRQLLRRVNAELAADGHFAGGVVGY
jgi:hypothetical protein